MPGAIPPVSVLDYLLKCLPFLVLGVTCNSTVRLAPQSTSQPSGTLYLSKSLIREQSPSFL